MGTKHWVACSCSLAMVRPHKARLRRRKSQCLGAAGNPGYPSEQQTAVLLALVPLALLLWAWPGLRTTPVGLPAQCTLPPALGLLQSLQEQMSPFCPSLWLAWLSSCFQEAESLGGNLLASSGGMLSPHWLPFSSHVIRAPHPSIHYQCANSFGPQQGLVSLQRS